MKTLLLVAICGIAILGVSTGHGSAAKLEIVKVSRMQMIDEFAR